jgi:hypothetical protein
VVGRKPARFLRLHAEDADTGVLCYASGEPAAADDRNRAAIGSNADGPAEEHVGLAVDAHGEEAGVLEKERPLLGKEQIESIEVDLLFVNLDLREIGVVGRIERQARRHAVLQIDADVAQLGRAAL